MTDSEHVGAGDASGRAEAESSQGARGTRGLGARIGLSLVSLAISYFVLGNLLWLWNHQISSSRLSTEKEVREFHEQGYSFGLYEYHPVRQATLRRDHRGLRHGIDGYWMQTDERGLAYLPPNEGELNILILGDSVAFGSWLPYEASFPGLLARALNAKVFSGATESYNLRQTHDLFEEVGGEWDLILYVWVPNDFYEWRYRETPFERFPRAGLARPLDLFDVKDLSYRLFDLAVNKPEGLLYDEGLAWNRQRYDQHLGLIRDMNRDGNLVVALTYLSLQLGTDRLEPQRWMMDGLEEMGVRSIDTLAAYGEDMFAQESDHVHLNPDGMLRWSEFVTRELVRDPAAGVAGR